MKASEAKTLAENAIASDRDMSEIYNGIREQAKKGNFSLSYHKEINELQKRTLRSKGYTISNLSGRDGTLFVIGWGDK